jgi:hypothetical protein
MAQPGGGRQSRTPGNGLPPLLPLAFPERKDWLTCLRHRISRR